MGIAFYLLSALFLAALVVLAVLLRRSWKRLREVESEGTRMRDRVHELSRMEREHAFVAGLVGDLPQFANRLYGRRSLREIPGVLIEILDRVFRPEEGLVLVRRRRLTSEPERDRHLIVAAASRGARRRKGRVVQVGDGEVGRVAEVCRIMDRQDFDRDPVTAREGDPLAGFRCDLAAPLEVGDQLLGVVAVMSPARSSSQNKPAMRLIAHLAAQALHGTRELKQMKSVADLDPLTGVFNKRVVSFRLGEWVHRAERHNERLAVFLFDLDHFKKFNDRNGHPAGDELLINLARLVEEQTRADDLFGRYGGEEFVLLMPDRNREEAAAAAEKIRSTIESHPFNFGDGQPLGKVTISGGVAVFPDDARDSSSLLRAADRALYEAKRSGRNQVAVPSADASADGPDPSRSAPPLVREPDDLCAIRGIGTTFAERLNEAGLIYYHQVASLTWQDLRTLAERLGAAPERIVRDRWIDQARQLHFRKYGERLEGSAQ